MEFILRPWFCLRTGITTSFNVKDADEGSDSIMIVSAKSSESGISGGLEGTFWPAALEFVVPRKDDLDETRRGSDTARDESVSHGFSEARVSLTGRWLRRLGVPGR